MRIAILDGEFNYLRTVDCEPASLPPLWTETLPDSVPDGCFLRWCGDRYAVLPLPLEVLNYRNQSINRVNAEAGDVRARYITVTNGQQATYIEKQAEAMAYQSGQPPGTYPYLEEEAAQTGVALDDLAAMVKATAMAWRTLNAKIEGVRRGIVTRLQAAPTAAAIDDCFPVAWPG